MYFQLLTSDSYFVGTLAPDKILVHGRKIPVSEMCDRIDEITPDDIRRVAHRYFGTDTAKSATLVAMGKEDVGDWRAQLRKYGVGGA